MNIRYQEKIHKIDNRTHIFTYHFSDHFSEENEFYLYLTIEDENNENYGFSLPIKNDGSFKNINIVERVVVGTLRIDKITFEFLIKEAALKAMIIDHNIIFIFQ